MIERGRLVRDERPAFYVYRLTWHGRSQTGIVGAAAVRDYEERRIKKHEHTRPDKVRRPRAHRTSRSARIPGPVFLAYRRSAALDGEPRSARRPRRPRSCFARTAMSSTSCGSWTTRPASRPSSARGAEVPSHVCRGRAPPDGGRGAGVRGRCGVRSRRRPADEPVPFYFLAVHFPSRRAADSRLQPRGARSRPGLDVPAFLDRARECGFDVRSGHAERRPPRNHTFGLYAGGRTGICSRPGPEIVDVERSRRGSRRRDPVPRPARPRPRHSRPENGHGASVSSADREGWRGLEELVDGKASGRRRSPCTRPPWSR